MDARTEDSLATVDWNDQTYRILLSGNATAGRVGIFESSCAPKGGPPRHVHLSEDETFYVIDGEMVFWLDGVEVMRRAGEVAFIPRGTEHSFTVDSTRPARFVVHLAPGGMEAFFVAAAARDLQIPRDKDAVAKLALEYNMKITGPPLRG